MKNEWPLKSRTEVKEMLKSPFSNGFSYIARDPESNVLCLFSLKPKKYRDIEAWGYVDENAQGVKPCKIIRNTDITEINWKNQRPTLISDFLEMCE